MKPAPFEYHRPTTRGDALGLLTTHGGDAKPLAGGQSLIPAMNFRLATPAILVDLNAIGDLAYIRADETGDVRMGAMTRHATVERSDVIRRAAPLVHEAMPFIAHAAIRTRGTIGGSLAHADPAAELPAVMLALDARIRVESRAGAREIPASEFFTGLFSTALESGELLTEILIPLTRDNARAGVAFQEFSRRRGDFALAGVDYWNSNFKLARAIHAHQSAASLPWESERVVDIVHGFLAKWARDGLRDPDLLDWLARFQADKWRAARDFWDELYAGMDEAFAQGFAEPNPTIPPIAAS